MVAVSAFRYRYITSTCNYLAIYLPLYVEVCAGPARARRDDGGRGEAGGGRGAGRGQEEQGQPHGQHLDGAACIYTVYIICILYLNVYI